MNLAIDFLLDRFCEDVIFTRSYITIGDRRSTLHFPVNALHLRSYAILSLRPSVLHYTDMCHPHTVT